MPKKVSKANASVETAQCSQTLKLNFPLYLSEVIIQKEK